MPRTIPTVATVLILAAGAAFAGTSKVPADRAAAVSQKNQPARAAAERREDFRNLARLESMAAEFDSYRDDGDLMALKLVCRELRLAALAEISESHKQIPAGGREALGNSREARDARRELQTAGMSGPAAGDSKELRQIQNAARDRRDDYRERAATMSIQERRYRIAQGIRDVSMGLDPSSLDHQRKLLGDLIEIAGMEGGAREADPGVSSH